MPPPPFRPGAANSGAARGKACGADMVGENGVTDDGGSDGTGRGQRHRCGGAAARVRARIAARGSVQPGPLQAPPGVLLHFPTVNTCGHRTSISRIGPMRAGGALANLPSQAGAEVGSKGATAPVRRTGPEVRAVL